MVLEAHMAARNLDVPARLLWWPTTPQSMADWKSARTYGTLRAAVRAAMTEAPTDQKPWILTDSGTLELVEIDELWQKMQRPSSS